MLLRKIDAKDILSIVRKFSNKSSLDCNDMNMSIIKEIIAFVVSPFTYIVICLYIVVISQMQ